jgi:surface antigen
VRAIEPEINGECPGAAILSAMLRGLAGIVTGVVISAAAAGTVGGGKVTSTPIAWGYPYASRCPGAGLAEVVDRWGMYACNCTSYAAWALVANGQRVDWFVPGSMDAWNWPHVARLAGIPVDRRPEVGAVAVWPQVARPFGHVAYVTGVGPGRRIDVAEYNYPGGTGAGTFGFDTRSSVPAGAALFIHVPRRSR